MMRWAVLLLAGVVLCGGCKRQPVATYKGKAAGEWIQLAADRDTKTRAEAVKALSEIGGEDCKAALVANVPTAIDSISIPAMYGAAEFPDTDGVIIPQLRSLLKNNPTIWSREDVVAIFLRMGKRAAPLAPDLNQGLKDPNPLPGERERIERMLKASQ